MFTGSSFSIQKDGKIQNIAGFTVDNNGNIYISDVSSNTIDKYDHSGKQLYSLEYEDFDPGELYYYDQHLYCAHRNINLIKILDLKGAVKKNIVFSHPYNDSKLKISCIAVTEDHFFIGDTLSGTVMKFASNGIFMFKIGGEYENTFTMPSAVRVRDTYIYVGDLISGKIYRFNRYGKCVAYTEKHHCDIIDSFFVAENNIVVATDWKKNILNIYDTELNYMRKYDADLLQPAGIVYREPYIYVADTMNGRVCIIERKQLFAIEQDTEKYVSEKNRQTFFNDISKVKRSLRNEKDIERTVEKFSEIKNTFIEPVHHNKADDPRNDKNYIDIKKITQLITLPMFSSSAKDHIQKHLIIYINNSITLNDHFNEFKASLIKFIEKLEENTAIRVITSDSDIRTSKSILKNKVLSQINTISLNAQADFWKGLYETLYLIQGEKNISCIIITETIDESLYNINNIKNIKIENTSEFFIIGYNSMNNNAKRQLKELSDHLHASLFFIQKGTFEINLKSTD